MFFIISRRGPFSDRLTRLSIIHFSVRSSFGSFRIQIDSFRPRFASFRFAENYTIQALNFKYSLCNFKNYLQVV